MSDWTNFRWTKYRRDSWNKWTDMLESKRVHCSKFVGEHGAYELYVFCSDNITAGDVQQLIDQSRPDFAPNTQFVGCEELMVHELSAFIDAAAYVGNPPDKKIIYY